jgi:hypothetical protein
LQRDCAATYKTDKPRSTLVHPAATANDRGVHHVFGKVLDIQRDGVPPLLFYLSLRPDFAQSLQNTSATFVNNASIFGKVYFPRLIVPLSSVVSNLPGSAIQLVTSCASSPAKYISATVTGLA